MGTNVLLIVFDTARADRFEPYGSTAGSTPAVAQLAAEGTAHPLAFAPSSWTVPSHVSLFTGLLPGRAGLHLIEQTHDGFRQALDHFRDRSLPSVLSRHGYRTVGISANGWVNGPTGFDIGFDQFEYVASHRHVRLGGGWRARTRWAYQALQARLDDGAARIEALVADAVRGRRPFFCFVNLVECHSPYLPPRPYNPLGRRDRMRAAADANRYCTLDAFWNIALGVSPPPPADVIERMQALYDGSIAQLDAWLARVLDALDRAGLRPDTQVVVTSDHGENLGEAGLTGHNFSLDDRLIRVPFVTSGPLHLRTPRAVSLVDVPTLLGDALGIDGHPWDPVSPDRDIAVAQFVAPVRAGEPGVEEGLQRWDLDPAARKKLLRSFECATDGRTKVFRDEDGETVVDLATDPLELAPDPLQPAPGPLQPPAGGGVVTRLRQALDEADRTTLTDVPWSAPVAASMPTERHGALADQMRLLGYL